jgi:hypothetical protein
MESIITLYVVDGIYSFNFDETWLRRMWKFNYYFYMQWMLFLFLLYASKIKKIIIFLSSKLAQDRYKLIINQLL